MPETPELTDRLSLLKSRLKVAKAWSKKPHEAWKRWINEYEIEDVSDTNEIRDRVRIGYIFRKIESDLPAIFDDQPDLFMKGRQGNVRDIEPLINGAYDFLWDIQRLEEHIENVGLYFDLLGMGFIESPYVTRTKKVTEIIEQPVLDELGQPLVDEAGQPVTQPVEQVYETPIIDHPQARVPDPFKLFFSPETSFNTVLDYEHCKYYFEEHVMTLEEVKARFGKVVEATDTMTFDDTDAQTELDRELKDHKDDLKRVKVWEYYGCLPEAQAKGIKDKQGNAIEWTYDRDYHLFFTANEELLAEECQYDTKPLFVISSYGLANKFWRFGDAKHLMPLVQELEQYRTQILRHTRKMANPKPLIPNEAGVDEEAFSDPRTGKAVKYDASTGHKPEYLSPANLGREVQVGVEMVRTDLEKTSGSFDLSNGASQSTVKTPRGIQVYSEAADRNVRRKRKKVARLIRELIIFQFKQLASNWRPEDEKTIAIMGQDGMTEEAPVTDEVLQVLGGVNILYVLDIEIESLSVNKVQMRQDALDLWDLAQKSPDIFDRKELGKWLLESGFAIRDGDRFLMTPQKVVAQMQEQQAIQTMMAPPLDTTLPEGGSDGQTSQPQPGQALPAGS